MPQLEGITLGPYRLKRLLGKGGMAEVYLAEDVVWEDEVAIKVIEGHDPDMLERLRREAEAIDKLQHKHILPVFDYDDQEQWHYMVMLYVQGGTLRQRLQHRRLSVQEAGIMLEQVASALQFAHDHGIIHRDVKPSNILLRDRRYAYLADFGLAKITEGDRTLTQMGMLMGTPEYMAPDLANGPATIQSDIYALGIVLYQMVTGRVPFSGETPVEIYSKQLNEQPLPPSYWQPELSTSVDRVILRALSKDPSQRYQSVHTLVTAYQQALHYDEMGILAPMKLHADSAMKLPTIENIFVPRHVRPPKRAITSDQPDATHPSQPGEAGSSRPPLLLREPLPPLPLRIPSDAENTTTSRGPVSLKTGQNSRPKKLSLFVTSIILLGLLIFVLLPMGYLSYVYTHHTITSTPLNKQKAAIKIITPTPVHIHPTPQNSPTAVSNTPAGATIILNDGLAHNTAGRWMQDTVHCYFANNAYQVVGAQSAAIQPCQLLAPAIPDSTNIQVNVSLLSGNNTGILLRLNEGHYYDFEITDAGHFFFRRHDGGNANITTTLIPDTTCKAIARGITKNTLRAEMQGDNFKLFINGTVVGEVHDATYTDGQLAFTAGTLSFGTWGQGSFSQLSITSSSPPT